MTGSEGQYENILVRAPNWLGDVIMITPHVRALRGAFPKARISVLVKKPFAGVFENSDAVDEIIPFDSDRGWKNIFALKKVIKGRGFDLAVIFPRSFRSAFSIFLARVPNRIGYKVEMRGLMLTEALAREKDLLRTHRVNYYANLLAPLGITEVPDRTEIFPSDRDGERVRELLQFRGEGPLLAMHCGASYGTAKQWPHEKFAGLARKAREEFGATVVLIGGKAEAGAARKIAESADCDCIVTAGKTSVGELAALLRECDLLVTNDTGPMHVADAAGTRIVAIFGPTDPVTTSPYGPNARIVTVEAECSPCLKRVCPTDHRCMKDISVEIVLDEVRSMFAARADVDDGGKE